LDDDGSKVGDVGVPLVVEVVVAVAILAAFSLNPIYVFN
jgi:hypothetical protein